MFHLHTNCPLQYDRARPAHKPPPSTLSKSSLPPNENKQSLLSLLHPLQIERRTEQTLCIPRPGNAGTIATHNTRHYYMNCFRNSEGRRLPTQLYSKIDRQLHLRRQRGAEDVTLSQSSVQVTRENPSARPQQGAQEERASARGEKKGPL